MLEGMFESLSNPSELEMEDLSVRWDDWLDKLQWIIGQFEERDLTDQVVDDFHSRLCSLAIRMGRSLERLRGQGESHAKPRSDIGHRLFEAVRWEAYKTAGDFRTTPEIFPTSASSGPEPQEYWVCS